MILPGQLLLAAANPDKPGTPTLSDATRKMMIGATPVFIIALSLLFALIIWAVFIRRSQRPRRERGRLILNTDSDEDDSPLASNARKRRRRRRREKNRPRNPTLSETGGLPPKRDPNTPTPPPDF